MDHLLKGVKTVNDNDYPVDVAIVVPVYNEQNILKRSIEQIHAAISETDYSFEIVFIDDGSTDGSRTVLSEAALNDERIRPILLSRNFGKEAALAAGLQYARGACLIFMDADLQHPVSVIGKLLSEWDKGYDIVNARKRNRGSENIFSSWFSVIFNQLMSNAIGTDFRGASDFKLIDAHIADILRAMPERNRFFRGLVSWVGFKSADVEFDVDARLHGHSKWAFFSLVKYAVKNIIAFSNLPLRIVAYSGFIVSAFGSLLLFKALYDYVVGKALTGFTTVIGVQVLLGGMLLVAQGTIALYIAKMYEEQKARPIFLVDERQNKMRRNRRQQPGTDAS